MARGDGLWRRVPVRRLDRKLIGYSVVAVEHRSGALLLHHRPFRTTYPRHAYIGVWWVLFDGRCVARRSYYGFPFTRSPVAWATRVIKPLIADLPRGLCGDQTWPTWRAWKRSMKETHEGVARKVSNYRRARREMAQTNPPGVTGPTPEPPDESRPPSA